MCVCDLRLRLRTRLRCTLVGRRWQVKCPTPTSLCCGAMPPAAFAWRSAPLCRLSLELVRAPPTSSWERSSHSRPREGGSRRHQRRGHRHVACQRNALLRRCCTSESRCTVAGSRRRRQTADRDPPSRAAKWTIPKRTCRLPPQFLGGCREINRVHLSSRLAAVSSGDHNVYTS